MKPFHCSTVLDYIIPFVCLSGMADESLFDFLHMEIVSHVYKEQQAGKGEMDNKVCSVKT